MVLHESISILCGKGLTSDVVLGPMHNSTNVNKHLDKKVSLVQRPLFLFPHRSLLLVEAEDESALKVTDDWTNYKDFRVHQTLCLPPSQPSRAVFVDERVKCVHLEFREYLTTLKEDVTIPLMRIYRHLYYAFLHNSGCSKQNS
jgi:hypothetical protein